MKADIFEDLFVLEMANNHLGKLERGLAIVDKFSKIVRFNNVRATIKIQLRDVNTLIHVNYRQREDIRYIKKTLHTDFDGQRRAKIRRHSKRHSL
jgi:N-acetylneuraminate synthase